MKNLQQRLENLGIIDSKDIETDFNANSEGLAGLGEESKAIIKVYSMYSIEPVPKNVIDGVRAHLEDWIKTLENPFSGLGFAIISTDFLNISLWDNAIHYLPVNKVLNFRGGFDSPTDVTSGGAYCAGELAIAVHEAYFWLQYLRSERSVKDKEEYLKSFINGPLLVPSEEKIRWESREPKIDTEIPF